LKKTQGRVTTSNLPVLSIILDRRRDGRAYCVLINTEQSLTRKTVSSEKIKSLFKMGKLPIEMSSFPKQLKVKDIKGLFLTLCSELSSTGWLGSTQTCSMLQANILADRIPTGTPNLEA
jgi:hypothetical protein